MAQALLKRISQAPHSRHAYYYSLQQWSRFRAAFPDGRLTFASEFSTSTQKASPTVQSHEHEHIPLSKSHKLALTIGSALASLYNPARGDMIALLSELSGEPLLPKLRDMMLKSDEGRALLMQKPAINTSSVDMKYLENLEEHTLGKQYWNWLKWCNVGPDTRAKVCTELWTETPGEFFVC